jgi:hypothetical protein
MRYAIKVGVLVALAVLLLPSDVAAQANPYGDWKAVFTGPLYTRPKPFSEVTFSIRPAAGGPEVTAQAGYWPGQMDISDVTLRGNRVTFVGTGRKGWGIGSGGTMTYHCCPRMSFDGSIQGDEMTLTMTGLGLQSPMKATRVPESEPLSLYVFYAMAYPKARRSEPVGVLEGAGVRVTLTAGAFENPYYASHLRRGVRIDFNDKGTARTLMIEQTDIEALRRALPTTGNRGARTMDIEGCGAIANSARGLNMCAHQLNGTVDDLDALLARSQKVLDSSF